MRFHDGIEAQPKVLRRSAESLRAAVAGLPPLAPGALVALVGIGASEHAARSAAVVWRSQGLRAFAVPASELLHGGRVDAEVFVGISESGRSSETLAALQDVEGRRVALTNFVDSPIAEMADESLHLDSGPDSPVYTTGYTATLQALGLLGEHWAGEERDWDRLPSQASDVLEGARVTVDAVAASFDRARIVDVVASGASLTTAGEGALMLRESARLHTAGHETHNYLHGPMEPIETGAAAIVVGDGRELRLAQDLSHLGCSTLLITRRPGEVVESDTLRVIALPDTPSGLADAVLEILPVQVLARALADKRGLAVDGFRYEQDDIKLDGR
jgi:fructoselysine-6-P-deglycase FrlB-like protein